MKAIKCCGDCQQYDWKKHKCMVAHDEGGPQDHFYADCPLLNVPEWISVKDRLPVEFQNVVVFFAEGRIGVDFAADGKFVCQDLSGGITHWMPLPEPPIGGEDHG